MVAYPGAAQGTQRRSWLRTLRDRASVGDGELFRAEVALGTRRRGKVAADYLRKGDLVPDELVFEMVLTPLLEAARNGGYVLDGFPRTLRQAEEAYSVAQEREDVALQAVFCLRVGHDERAAPAAPGDRAEREGRTDDTEVGIAHRFEVFETETEPLLALLPRTAAYFVDINGEQPVEDVFHGRGRPPSRAVRSSESRRLHSFSFARPSMHATARGRRVPTIEASTGTGPSAQRSPMPAWNVAKAGDDVSGFTSPSSTATCRKLSPSSRRKAA